MFMEDRIIHKKLTWKYLNGCNSFVLVHQMSTVQIRSFPYTLKMCYVICIVLHLRLDNTAVLGLLDDQEYIHMLPLATNEGPDTLHNWWSNYIFFILLGFYFSL